MLVVARAKLQQEAKAALQMVVSAEKKHSELEAEWWAALGCRNIKEVAEKAAEMKNTAIEKKAATLTLASVTAELARIEAEERAVPMREIAVVARCENMSVCVRDLRKELDVAVDAHEVEDGSGEGSTLGTESSHQSVDALEGGVHDSAGVVVKKSGKNGTLNNSAQMFCLDTKCY